MPSAMGTAQASREKPQSLPSRGFRGVTLQKKREKEGKGGENAALTCKERQSCLFVLAYTELQAVSNWNPEMLMVFGICLHPSHDVKRHLGWWAGIFIFLLHFFP